MIDCTHALTPRSGRTRQQILLGVGCLLLSFAASFADTTELASLASAPPTAVHKAVKDNDIGLLQDLLVNADPALANSVIGRGVTPLHLAAALNRAEAADLLLQHGAAVDARTEGGFTPLHWAASKDAVATVTVLLKHGADVNARTDKGITPLHWAASRDATNSIPLLLEAGANTAAETDNGSQPLHWAYLNEREGAALMIADRIVSSEMESERTNVSFTVESEPPAEPADELEEPPAVMVEEPDPATNLEMQTAMRMPPEPELPPPAIQTDIYITAPTTNAGRALIVNIGLGETMVFEWLEPIKLWAGKYEVSNGQFRRFRPSHTSRFREKFTLDANDQPAVYVSWTEAVEFCTWLNRTYKDRLPRGFSFRLPFAVEWTYMARCSQNRRYPWGNRWPPAYGNFADLTAREKLAEWSGLSRYDDGFPVTCPVAKSGANEWGIYGLAGNVWEWCEDWYGGEHRYKIRRGGSWDFDGEPNLRISAMGFDRPEVTDDTIGFRVVASEGP